MAVMKREVLVFVLTVAFASFIGFGFCYDRPAARKDISIPIPSDYDSGSPQQVHIYVVGLDKMRVSWVTESSAPSVVDYGTSPGAYTNSATGISSSYKYKSGQIHDVVIDPLDPSTVYYYRCGSDSTREFSFKTPPAQLPIKFAVIGMLSSKIDGRSFHLYIYKPLEEVKEEEDDGEFNGNIISVNFGHQEQ